MNRFSGRKKTALLLIVSVSCIIAITIAGILMKDKAMVADFTRKNMSPSFLYPFGTDFMGREMLSRTICGLSLSIRVGLITAAASSVIALILGTISALGGHTIDSIITWTIDLVMGVPHILMLILISYACGKGAVGVIVGVTLSHWMSLARLIRGEILQLKESGYVMTAQKLGISRTKIALKHMVPHVFPQFIVGMILLFPHAILHEASITFLGFGLSTEQPAIGVILSESMKYLATGQWWIALFPGLLLVFMVMLFDLAGKSVRKLLDPASVHM